MGKSKFDVAASIFIILSVLSTLLVLVINHWYVLIVNACEMFIFGIVFRHAEIPPSIFIVTGVIFLGVCAIFMIFPTSVCRGINLYYSNNKGTLHQIEVTLSEYRTRMGILMGFLVLYNIAVGIFLFVDYDEEGVSPCCFMATLGSMGGIMILNGCISDFVQNSCDVFGGFFGIPMIALLYAGGAFFIKLLIALNGGYSGGDHGGGSSKKYDVVIIEHDD